MSDLKEKIDELRANPELYKKIVENGAQFAEEILSPQTIKDYWLKVLTAISKDSVLCLVKIISKESWGCLGFFFLKVNNFL